MSKFKNKKALTLAVGAIMAGVSVIGVVAACAPTKAKSAKPSEKKVEQPQTGGNESSNPGSGSTTTPSGQSSNNGGTTTTPSGSNNKTPETTQPSTPPSSPKDGTGSDSMSKPKQPQVESQPKDSEKKEDDTSTPGTSDSEKSKTETEKNEMPKVDAEPNKTPETGDTNPDKKTGAEDGMGTNKKPETGNTDETGEKTQTEEDKLKAEQEAEAKKKAEAEKMLSDKKASAKTEIENLEDISDERIPEIIAEIEKIDNPSEIDKITKIVDDAKQEDKKHKDFNDKKRAATQEINGFNNISEENKNKFLAELQKITDISKIQDIQNILQEARKQEAAILAKEVKLMLADPNSSLNRRQDNFLYLRVKASEQDYKKLEEKPFVLLIEKDGSQVVDEPAVPFTAGDKTVYHFEPSRKDGFVTFTISSIRTYKDNEPGKYKVTEVYIAGDAAKKSILEGQSNTISIPSNT